MQNYHNDITTTTIHHRVLDAARRAPRSSAPVRTLPSRRFFSEALTLMRLVALALLALGGALRAARAVETWPTRCGALADSGLDGFEWHTLIPQNRTSPRELVIVAGEGTTGTTSMAAALTRLGLRSQHGSAGPAGNAIKNMLGATSLADARAFDVGVFDPVDAVLDSPVSHAFPVVFAHFPRARVILTVRNATQWAEHRIKEHGLEPAPLASFYDASYAELKYPGSAAPARRLPQRMRIGQLSVAGVAWAFAMQNLLFSCLVPEPQLLVLNLFRAKCDSDFLWGELLGFLGRENTPEARAALGPFPHCHRRRRRRR
jgi:hypothetical protein